jgi:hypothetical protein
VTNAQQITLSEVESLKRRAIESSRDDDLRAYLDQRKRYREWTLNRLSRIEADESEQ